MSVVSDGGEDQEDSSSVDNSTKDEFKSALDEFREIWQKELKSEGGNLSSHGEIDTNKSPPVPDVEVEENDQTRAERLFLQGVDCEKRGKVFDALNFYRRAVQIVPDIEFRIYESAKAKMVLNQASETKSKGHKNQDLDRSNDNIPDVEDDEDLSNVDLLSRFQCSLAKASSFIQRANYEKGMITTGAHISDLPVEILLYIFRWVVSSQLDTRSLEICARVCKGFYVCSKDEEIWKLACLRVWGVNTGTLKGSPFSTWRQMFNERNRVHFHGCYISKTSYLRYGENSFQDQFYRPVQLIEYFRYMRFFPDGKILSMTTADEPAQCVAKLKGCNQARPEILKGHYSLHGDLVIIVLKRKSKSSSNHGSQRKGTISQDNETITFYIEMKIISSPKRRFSQLQWKHYSIIQVKNKLETTTDFDLPLAKYPPLWFSRVKSYGLESELPLE